MSLLGPYPGLPPNRIETLRSEPMAQQDYPHRHETFYDRGVWAMGEDGEDGLVVEGHDRRAWAALNAYARTYDGRSRLDLPWADLSKRVQLRWATFRESCGCTAEEHADHAAEQHAVTTEFVTRRNAGASIAEAAQNLPTARTCDEITAHDACRDLPPCETELFSWVADWQDDPASRAATALPVLVTS